MAKCDSKGFVVKAEQIGKLKNDDVIAISVTDDLASCAKIDTRNILPADAPNVTNLKEGFFYNAANVPVDVFGCSKNQCYNSGTYQGTVATAATDVVIGDYKKAVDATLYAAGIVVAYFQLPEGTHTVKMDITSYTDTDWSNFESFETTVYATKGDGLYPARFDLTEVAGDPTGNGWTPNQIGVKLRFTIDGENLAADDLVGVSSIAFYESIEDLELNKTILVTCIDTWGDSQSFDVIEGACATSEYDPNSGTMTASITVNKFTDSLKFLNPTLHTTDVEEFGILNVVTRKVQDANEYFTAQGDTALAAELNGYGMVQLSDMVEKDCGFVYVQTPGCANNSSELTRVASPVPVINPTTDSTKFQVLTSDYKGDETMGLVLVSKDWVGQELNFVYRKKVTAEVQEVTNEFRDFHANILAPLRKKDGTIEWHKYENAFITTLNNNISRSDETTIELQFTIAADENGVRKQIAKILES